MEAVSMRLPCERGVRRVLSHTLTGSTQNACVGTPLPSHINCTVTGLCRQWQLWGECCNVEFRLHTDVRALSAMRYADVLFIAAEKITMLSQRGIFEGLLLPGKEGAAASCQRQD